MRVGSPRSRADAPPGMVSVVLVLVLVLVLLPRQRQSDVHLAPYAGAPVAGT